MKTLIKILFLSVLWFSCESPADPEDTISPIATITFPASESQLTETTIIRAEILDDNPITKVIFFIDGIPVFEDLDTPYEYEWDICSEDNGNHTILVKAEDESGNQGQTDAMVVETNGIYDCYGVCGGDIFDADQDDICDDIDDCPNDSNNDADGDGICDDSDDCVGEYDDCGVCNGDGTDEDEDGICDDIDDCIGNNYDECGVCDGNGAYECWDGSFECNPEECPSEEMTLELLIPSDNNLVVIGGGGNESVTISAEIRDPFGDYADNSYAVIFTVPCPFPIDGICPMGDGDFSNDIMLDGIPSSGSIPTVIAETTNGEASVTLNSGNRPGLVLINAQLCTLADLDDGICDDVLYEAERIAASISAGPATYGQVVSDWTEADSTGGGVYSVPITATFWDQWTNPISDSTSVYWYINPEYIASVDPDSKIGNCGNGEPGQACTNAYYTSGEIFSTGQICAKVSGQVGGDVIACSGGARCEDFSEFDCFSNQDLGCTWNEEFDECYFIASEKYCNTLFTQEECESSENSMQAPYNCLWDEVAVAAIPEWQPSIADGAGCHYAPLVNGLDEQQFSFDADGDGVDDPFTGEWEAAGIIAPDDPFCNISGLNAIQYQQYSEECASKTVCSWEFVAGGTGSSDGSIGSCLYNGGASGTGYFNPCVDCSIEIIPLSPTVTDYCQTDDEPLDILIRGSLTDAYGDPVSLGTLLMAVFDASAFNFVSSDDTTIDEDMGYEFDPPIPANATQITDANGEVYWIVRLPNENCQQTNPDDPDVFSCNNVYMRAYLLDPLNGESADLNTILYKNCQP